MFDRKWLNDLKNRRIELKRNFQISMIEVTNPVHCTVDANLVNITSGIMSNNLTSRRIHP